MEQVAVMWDGFIHHAYWTSHHTVTYYIYAPETTNHKNHQSPLPILPTPIRLTQEAYPTVGPWSKSIDPSLIGVLSLLMRLASMNMT